MRLSRIVAALALGCAPQLASAQSAIETPAASAIETYRRLTSVAVRCGAGVSSSTIIVCGRRAADRWRVPLVETVPGDPRTETISQERNRLASEPPRKCGTAAILVNCGMVGVGTTIGFGASGTTGPKVRPLAD